MWSSSVDSTTAITVLLPHRSSSNGWYPLTMVMLMVDELGTIHNTHFIASQPAQQTTSQLFILSSIFVLPLRQSSWSVVGGVTLSEIKFFKKLINSVCLHCYSSILLLLLLFVGDDEKATKRRAVSKLPRRKTEWVDDGQGVVKEGGKYTNTRTTQYFSIQSRHKYVISSQPSSSTKAHHHHVFATLNRRCIRTPTFGGVGAVAKRVFNKCTIALKLWITTTLESGLGKNVALFPAALLGLPIHPLANLVLSQRLPGYLLIKAHNISETTSQSE